jgi:polyphosphate glucokinase
MDSIAELTSTSASGRGQNGALTHLVGGTLCVDIGGTNIKGMVLDSEGKPLSNREREPTPRPAEPPQVIETIQKVVARLPSFERVTIGFPGVVIDGVTKTAPNLDGGWGHFDILNVVQEMTQKPTRVLNDADIQGLAVIDGKGVEMLVTLGTGMGAAVYIDGRLFPNLELGHHPWKKGRTYEQYVSMKELKRVGPERWTRRVHKMVEQLEPIFNYRQLYIGGGNARKLAFHRFQDNVRIIDNIAGILGGIRLWQ